MALLLFTTAAGKVIYVDTDVNVKGNGKAWKTAYRNLQDAINNATAGDEIWVSEGIYKPSETVGGKEIRHRSFQLKNKVALYGGFSAIEIDRDQRDWQLHKTVLSGDLNGDDAGLTNNDENCYHVVTGNETDSSAVIDGFTVTAGNANVDVWPDDGGGGMNNYLGSPTVRNCTFIGNAAYADGGGIRNWGDCKPTIKNCSFRNNKVSQEGGGIMNGPDSSPIIMDCIFLQNSAGEDGGGMYNNESIAVVVNCIFNENLADLTGGGMYNVNGGNPTVTNCTFHKNVAKRAGGGISNNKSNPSITNCIIWDDSALTDSEIHNSESSPRVTYSVITDGYPGKGNIKQDPRLIDRIFRVESDSPCIDAGDNRAVPDFIKTDFGSNPRIINDNVDIGPYEFDNKALYR